VDTLNGFGVSKEVLNTDLSSYAKNVYLADFDGQSKVGNHARFDCLLLDLHISSWHLATQDNMVGQGQSDFRPDDACPGRQAGLVLTTMRRSSL
jgi:hypothetical protein